MQEAKISKRKSRGEDYVNNADFSAAVSEYVIQAKKDTESGIEPSMVTNYIAECLIKICNGLSRSPSFMTYSYREDMVMDAIENCLKAVLNYDITKSTRTGKPNSFAYFTQITYFAFLRRIAKEKKQNDIKQKMIDQGCIGMFADFDDSGDGSGMIGETMVERMRQKNDMFYKKENELAPIFEVPKPVRMAKKRSAKKESPLDLLFEDI